MLLRCEGKEFLKTVLKIGVHFRVFGGFHGNFGDCLHCIFPESLHVIGGVLYRVNAYVSAMLVKILPPQENTAR